MAKIKVNDINLYYERHGQGEPLVFVAGFGADHFVWSFVVERLSRNYEIVLLDNRGAGQSDVPEGPYSIEQMADDVYQLCQKIGISRANFVGSSMGGYIVQTLAYQYPEVVRSLVISNSVMKTNKCFNLYAEAQLELRKASAPAASLMKASLGWAYSSQYLSLPGKVEELITVMLNNPFPFTLLGYEGQFEGLSLFDSREWANKIKAQTLVIGSDQDLIFTEASVKELANAIPNASYYCFEDMGHLPFIERPKEFVDVLDGFLLA